MSKAGPLTLTALLALSLVLPQAALSQTESQATSAERNAAKAPPPPGVPTHEGNVHLPTEGEVKLGREGAQEVEKYYQIVDSGPYHERLQRISRDIAGAISQKKIIEDYKRVYNLPRKGDKSRRVPFEWSFRVVTPKPSDVPGRPSRPTKEINAFSLAAGYIFVTKDLMDVASDDELAAVLGHECAHVAYHHVEQLVKKQKKLNTAQLWGLLATVIAGAAGGGPALAAASNVMVGAQLVSIATLTGYGRELEHEADRAGVLALAGTDYNPVGMLTFMQKLQRDDAFRGYPSAGIFQSHPYSNERVAAIRKQLEQLGYKTDVGTQRAVSGTFRVDQELQRLGGKPVVELRLNGNLLFTVVAGEGDLSLRERANRISSQIEQLFAANLTYNDVRKSPDKKSVLLRGVPVIRVYPEDAEVMGSAEAAADKAYKEIIRALLKEQIEKPF